MKKILPIIGSVLVLALIIYLVSTKNSNDKYVTFNGPDLGINFDYKTGSDGYIVQESSPPGGNKDMIKALTLFRAEDLNKAAPVNGEGPPVMAIIVFRNSKNQDPEQWANGNTQYSGINLKNGNISQTSIDGAKAIRYRADGLYASENAVITHASNTYVAIGQFIEEDSDLRRDFDKLLSSIRFTQ